MNTSILLVNSPLFVEPQADFDEEVIPPLGLAYIATCLDRSGVNCKILDAVSENYGIDEVVRFINSESPSHTGLNIFSTNLEIVRQIIERVEIKTIFMIGGQAAKYLVDIIDNFSTNNKIITVAGDGELIVPSIVKNEQNLPLKRRETKFPRFFIEIDSSSEFFIANISTLTLDRRFILNEPNKHSKLGYSEAYLIASRGCIYSCTFCAAAKKLNKHISARIRSTENIKNEISNIVDMYGSDVDTIRVLDDLFLRNVDSIKEAIEIFNGYNLKWRSMAHILSFRNADVNLIRRLQNSGCIELFLGIESGSEKILKQIKKFSKIDDIANVFEMLFDANINVKAYFIFGFPGETYEDMNKTYLLALRLRKMALAKGVDFRPSAFKFRPYHGTEIYYDLLKSNIEIKAIETDQKLSNEIERKQFNFTSKNFSEVDDDILNNFLLNTLKLGEYHG